MEEYLQFCKRMGVHEVIILDPMAFGSGGGSEIMSPEQRRQLRNLQLFSASNPGMPKVTTAAYLESPDYLGCLAGYSFLYVNSAGDLFPCDFAPVSFGNVFALGFGAVIQRARSVIKRPCTKCLATRIAGTCGQSARFPLGWDQTEGLLSRLERDEPAALMKRMTKYTGA